MFLRGPYNSKDRIQALSPTKHMHYNPLRNLPVHGKIPSICEVIWIKDNFTRSRYLNLFLLYFRVISSVIQGLVLSLVLENLCLVLELSAWGRILVGAWGTIQCQDLKQGYLAQNKCFCLWALCLGPDFKIFFILFTKMVLKSNGKLSKTCPFPHSK